MVITIAKLRMEHASTHGARKPRGPISFFPKMSFQVCNPDIYGVFFCGREDLVTCGDIDENSGPHCSGCSLKNCVSCINTRIHLDHLTGKIVKTQLNHNQVKVGLTTLWVCNPPTTTTTQVKLCVVVVQVSSKQSKQQHDTGLNYVF